MKNKKLQVFVSSTFEDLRTERQAAVEAILTSGHIPAGMELFTAGDESQMKVIRRWIDESDVFMLILGERYGSVEPKTSRSYVELEYEYAVEHHKAHFACVIRDDVLRQRRAAGGKLELEQEDEAKVDAFRKRICEPVMVSHWEDAKDVQLAVFKALPAFVDREGLTGWVRADQNELNAGAVAENLSTLVRKNELLSKANATLRQEVQELRGAADDKDRFLGRSYEDMYRLLSNTTVSIGGDDRESLLNFMLENQAALVGRGIKSVNPASDLVALGEHYGVLESRTERVILTDEGSKFLTQARITGNPAVPWSDDTPF